MFVWCGRVANIITLLNLQERILSYLLQFCRAPKSGTKFIDNK